MYGEINNIYLVQKDEHIEFRELFLRYRPETKVVHKERIMTKRPKYPPLSFKAKENYT